MLCEVLFLGLVFLLVMGLLCIFQELFDMVGYLRLTVFFQG